MNARKIAFTGIAFAALMLAGTMEYRHLHQQADIFMKQIEALPPEEEEADPVPIVVPDDVYTPPIVAPGVTLKTVPMPRPRPPNKAKHIEPAPVDRPKVIEPKAADKPAVKEKSFNHYTGVCAEAKKYHDMLHGETQAGKEALKKLGHAAGYTDDQMTAVARQCHLD